MRPKYIKKGKEALNDENAELLTKLQTVQQENFKIKGNLNKVMRENEEMNKNLKELELYLARTLGVDKFSLNRKEVIEKFSFCKEFYWELRTFSFWL